MRRDKYDALFSDLIRESFDWTCARCGKYFVEGHRQGLHCSHIYSRRYKSVRYDPRNAVAHCYACHRWFGGNPLDGADWARAFLGEEEVSTLIWLKNQEKHWTKPEKEEMYQHYKKELDRIKKLRMQGKRGHIPVTPFQSGLL